MARGSGLSPSRGALARPPVLAGGGGDAAGGPDVDAGTGKKREAREDLEESEGRTVRGGAGSHLDLRPERDTVCTLSSLNGTNTNPFLVSSFPTSQRGKGGPISSPASAPSTFLTTCE